MNVKLYSANANGTVLEAVKALAKSCREGEFVLVVPDSYTLSFEREILAELEASFSVSVVTYRRLLNRLLRSERRFVDRATGAMAVRAAAESVRRDLATFGRSLRYPSFSRRTFELIASLKNCGIGPGELAEAAPAAGGALGGKLSDLAKIYAAYEALKGDSADSADLLGLLPALIEAEPAFADSCCAFAGFDIFTELGERVFAACARTFRETAFFANGTDNPVFAPVLLEKQIAALCLRRGIACERVALEGALTPFAAAAGRSLCRKRPVAFDPAARATFFAGTREEECEFCAREIRRLVAGGRRYADCCVVLSDAERYRDSLEHCFRRYEIPCWTDRKFRVADHPVARHLVGFLRAKLRGWPQAETLAWGKGPLVGADREEYDVFENYVLKYNISGKRFFAPFALAEHGDERKLAVAERVRAVLVRAVDELSGDPLTAALRFVEQRDFSAFTGPAAEPLFAAVSAQVPPLLAAVLHSLAELLPAPDERTFAELLESALDGQEISAIPLTTDCVFCGEKESVQYASHRVLFVLGMDEGLFPAVADDAGLLADRDVETLARCGLVFRPKNSENNLRQRFSVLKLLMNGYEKHYFSYCSDGQPCEQYQELLTLCAGSPQPLRLVPEQFSSERERLRVACRAARAGAESALEQAVWDYERAHDGRFAALLDSYAERFEEKLPEELAGSLFYERGRTSVSALETYYRCPFQHFLRYGLRLAERDTAEMKALNIGNLLHEVLQRFMTRADYTAAAARMGFDEVLGRDEYGKFRDDERFAPTLARIRTEAERVCLAVADTVTGSDFSVLACERKFADIELAGSDVRLEGKIDRVDCLEGSRGRYCRVVDYKSGRAEFHESELYFGRKLQLFLYLCALERREGLTPAGAYYFPVHNKFTEDAGRAYRLRGVTRGEEEVLRATDRDYRERAEFVRVDAQKKNLAEPFRLEGYVDYAEALAAEAIRACEGGDIRLLPAADACAFCPYRGVCAAGGEPRPRRTSGWDTSSVRAALLSARREDRA